MPELPDLEIFARNLNKQLGRKKVVRIEVLNKRKLKISVRELKKRLKGAN